ncbi:unannotated protein [freshwater metagenome]|uniref:Unannotated protein n=1 Tax=freshwater metagenome TaxID=449393 RepID=A0A6J7HRQ0_9ZZZZ
MGAFHDGLEHLRLRRDAPGALVFLEDGRYAITGRQAAIGGRDDVMRWALRRIAGADGGEERSWLQTALAGLAGDRRD